jgi:hypothetical protein
MWGEAVDLADSPSRLSTMSKHDRSRWLLVSGTSSRLIGAAATANPCERPPRDQRDDASEAVCQPIALA